VHFKVTRVRKSYQLSYMSCITLNTIMYGYRGSVRRVQNACTVCKLKCDMSSSFVCNDCVESTHALCIAMPEELIREFKRKTIKFCCPVCIRLSEKKGGGYDWQKSLKRYHPINFLMQLVLILIHLNHWSIFYH
jgi:hypothetical protein